MEGSSALTRSLALCIILQAFLENCVCATPYSQNFSQRPKRQLDSSQSPASRTLDRYIPNYVQVPEAGPWGPWTESSQCSRTCGGGVAHQDRICMDTRPDGSHSCTGAYRRYFSCNVQDCPQGSKDFRALQCARFNTVPHKGIYYSWEPYHHPGHPCELFCWAKGGSFYKKTDSKVIDGTKCRNDASLDICVDGQCMPVGCDNVLGSTKQEDECRVCGGDGSSCSLVSGLFDENQLDVGYNDILLIPAGATAILIEKTEPTKNFLAVRNTEGRYYLNGHWKIEFPRQLVFAGTVFHYERKTQGLAPEILRATGPTSEALFIVLLYQEKNLGVRYQYAVPAPAKTPSPNSYAWTTGEFEPCSQTCGGGLQARPVRCVRESDRDVADDRLCDPLHKPTVQQPCNEQPCSSSWKIGEWSECSAPCGGGTQFRVVYCHQMKEGNTVLVADETCEDPKPLFMRSCNLDKECPEWRTGEWSDCDSECGTGSQNRSVWCHSSETGEEVEEGLCDPQKKPQPLQSCTLGPCEGVEWIVSEWSGCDGSCSPRLESREVQCANEEGAVFPESACEARKKPERTRPCPPSPICEPMWHASQWTECSVKCGAGVESRMVFCGAWQDETVIKIDDDKCDTDKKFQETRECSTNDTCQGTWFTGPWNRCSVPCGGGERIRKILCFHEEEVVDSSHCDLNEEPDHKENCNMTPCDDDEMMTLGGCKSGEWGCCPDGMSAASGAQYEGCAPLNTTAANVSCEEADFGCCSDGFTLALGPFKKGCVANCTDSKHGCCPDGRTVASGPDMEGCPGDTGCIQSTHGCCPDGVTAASGPDSEGCPDCTNSTHGCCLDGVTAAGGPSLEGCPVDGDCTNSTHGCCPDGVTVSTSPNGTGCTNGTRRGGGLDIDIESSGEDCYGLRYGCCPDGLTPADGPDQSGCDEVENGTDCRRSAFGCCDDATTAALDPLRSNCEEGSGDGDPSVACEDSVFGCCPDNRTAARGFDLEGCDGCASTTFGCCPDNVTAASGENGEGCPTGDCLNTTFGCCPDNATAASGENGEGCPTGDCLNTTFGCCPDNRTAADGENGEGCDLVETNCADAPFGCCPGNGTAATGPDGGGCNVTIDCADSFYGCCPDNASMALGPDFEGCDNVTDCLSAEHGCCPDNVTLAQGPDFEGCPPPATEEPPTTTPAPECAVAPFGCCPDEVTPALGSRLEGCCFGLRFGCCPDNKTAALGPTFLGCGCQTYPFGCCPDNITPAQGPNYVGCRCEHTRHGCCQDQITPAQGPDHQGCDCRFLYYGCCPDGVTPARSDRLDGCGCDATRYGCCPDGRTTATSADLHGCPCSTLPYGCCPDGHTPARTPDLRDCPCDSQRYGCCPDGKTAARGPQGEGCPCDSARFGCCQDGRTAARGPGFEGCPCETTSHGCCADHYTPAKGPRFEGCPDVLVPRPKVSTEVCSLPKEPGPCRNYTIKWFFDLGYGGCSRFWYGGCDGNGNLFNTQEECEGACVRPEGPEVCLLPVVRGSCDGKVLSWYFDAGSKTCETFTYGGCLGNSNRFATKTDCVDKCVQNHHKTLPTPPTTEGGVCDVEHEIGPCNDFRERWYFDSESRECRRFFYGGCQGNRNNFGSLAECEKTCATTDRHHTPPPPPPPPTADSEFKTDYCFQLQDTGPCTSTEVNWYYDSRDGVCKEFYYGGCKGNRNRFETRKECEKSCFKAQDLCTLPSVRGPCSGTFPQWYYDASQDECLEFTFSGCQGNGNRFNDKEACHQRCKKTAVTTEPPQVVSISDVCSLPKEPGPCLGYYRSWYYDGAENACKSFIYGGCDGNDNRFVKRRECEQRCVTKKTPKEPKTPFPDRPQKPANEDVCRLPVDAGRCLEEHARWFYDAVTQSCLPFVYGGCEGNKNRFKTAEICLRFCSGIRVGREEEKVPFVTLPSTTTTTAAHPCLPSNCAEIQCPYGIEETFDVHGCSSCRCSNPCEVQTCPEGSRCVVDVLRTSRDAVRTEPVCRRVEKSGSCPSSSSGPRDCERRCRDDADCRGEHKCCDNGCAFTCMPPADLTFDEAKRPEPASILPGVNVTRGEVGLPAELPCHARGWPMPTVTWWRESTMLPLSSSRYQQMPDYALLIRSVVREDAGDYACHAHNGIGGGATYKVTLLIDFAAPDASRDQPSRPQPDVPVSTTVTLVSRDPSVGSPLQVDCEAEGPPDTAVRWQLGDRRLEADDRRRILSNHTLFITRAEEADTGEYKCSAHHHNNVATSSVYVQVKALPAESACVDNPQFKNCNLIVSAKYCNNKIYGKYCCASCMKAGQFLLQDSHP